MTTTGTRALCDRRCLFHLFWHVNLLGDCVVSLSLVQRSCFESRLSRCTHPSLHLKLKAVQKVDILAVDTHKRLRHAFSRPEKDRVGYQELEIVTGKTQICFECRKIGALSEVDAYVVFPPSMCLAVCLKPAYLISLGAPSNVSLAFVPVLPLQEQ